MEGICYIEEIDGEEWVVFNEMFNEELTPDIIQFLSKYKRVKFGEKFNQPVDIPDKDSPDGKSSILPQSLTHLEFGGKFNKPINMFPSSLKELKISKKYQYPLQNNIVIKKI